MLASTLGIGILASLVFGLVVQISDPELAVLDFYVILFHIFSGILYSVLSQLGFFAYMTLNYIALDMMRRKILWVYVQWFCVILSFAYLVGIRYFFFEENNQGLLTYTILPVLLLAAAIAVALYKSKLTNSTAFTPTLFFMFVVTVLESVPALRQNASWSTLGMVIPLFACNAWQILNLHKYVKSTKSP
jgi:KinB signaling pathway activation protein